MLLDPNLKGVTKKAKPLSELQKRIIAYFATYEAKFHRPPTIREVCAGASCDSTSVVSYNLTQLVLRGKLIKTGAGARGYALSSASRPDPLTIITAGYRRIVSGQDAHNVVLDMLYDLLPPLDRDVFKAIHAMPGTTSRTISETMPQTDATALFRSLNNLIELGLVEKLTNTGRPGFVYTVKGG